MVYAVVHSFDPLTGDRPDQDLFTQSSRSKSTHQHQNGLQLSLERGNMSLNRRDSIRVLLQDDALGTEDTSRLRGGH